MRRFAALAVGLVLVAGCSSSGSPAADLQTKINAVADAANAKDAAKLRTAAGELLQEVQSQSANGDITTTKAQDLKTVATRLLAEASVFDAASPVPSPSQADSPSPEPSPSRSPRPSRSPSPSPEPTEAPSSAPPSDQPPPIVITSSPAPTSG